MALDGGGGGGGPVGVSNSFTGTAEAIEIIGDHCFGYSGTFPASTTAASMFNFTTGNYYAVIQLQCNGYINLAAIGGGALGAWEVKLNENTVAFLKVTGSDETSPYITTQDMIIPPYTKVEVECTSTANDSSFLTTATISGRIYR